MINVKLRMHSLVNDKIANSSSVVTDISEGILKTLTLSGEYTTNDIKKALKELVSEYKLIVTYEVVGVTLTLTSTSKVTTITITAMDWVNKVRAKPTILSKPEMVIFKDRMVSGVPKEDVGVSFTNYLSGLTVYTNMPSIGNGLDYLVEIAIKER